MSTLELKLAIVNLIEAKGDCSQTSISKDLITNQRYIYDAIHDLKRIGVIEQPEPRGHYRLTPGYKENFALIFTLKHTPSMAAFKLLCLKIIELLLNSDFKIIFVNGVCDVFYTTQPMAFKAMCYLEALGIVKCVSDRERSALCRSYQLQKVDYCEILKEDINALLSHSKYRYEALKIDWCNVNELAKQIIARREKVAKAKAARLTPKQKTKANKEPEVVCVSGKPDLYEITQIDLLMDDLAKMNTSYEVNGVFRPRFLLERLVQGHRL